MESSNQSTYTIAFLIFVGVIFLAGIIVAAIVIPVNVVNSRYRKFVNAHSVALKELNDINKRCKFYGIGNFDMRHSYDNVNFYDSITCGDYLVYQLVFIKDKVRTNIDHVFDNRERMKFYTPQVEEARRKIGTYDEDIGKLKLKKLEKFERKQLINNKKKPETDFRIKVLLIRTNINGNVLESKRDYFEIDEILDFIDAVEQKRGNYYTNPDIWQAICRVERGKVTNKMRFAIYQRDGYRCKKCGRRDRGDNLEIDHIYPIAKGGKSTYDNLQTLCRKCNKEKGSRVDW